MSFCLHVCVYNMCACYLWGALDSLELELQIVVSHHISEVIESGSFGRSANDINYCAIIPAPCILV